MSRFAPTQRGSIRQTAREQERFAQQIKSFRYVVSLSPAEVASQSANEETVTVRCSSGDEVIVNGPSQTTGIVMGQAFVSATDEVTIPFINVTGGPLTPASGDYRIRVMR